MNDIPDDVIKSIMTFAHFGVGPMELESPASRFAHVNKKWCRLYQQATNESLFKTKELRRVTQGMTIRTCPGTAPGAGGVETILDCWEKVKGVPPWWTSSYVFEGGPWDAKNDVGTDNGPFYVAEGRQPPTLLIDFDRPFLFSCFCFTFPNTTYILFVFHKGLIDKLMFRTSTFVGTS